DWRRESSKTGSEVVLVKSARTMESFSESIGLARKYRRPIVRKTAAAIAIESTARMERVLPERFGATPGWILAESLREPESCAVRTLEPVEGAGDATRGSESRRRR